MKKLLMVCCFVVSIVSLSKAQGGGGRMQRTPEDQVTQLKTAVPTLTTDQSTKALAIFKTQTATRDSLMKTANGDFSSIREKMGPMQQATMAKISAILTDDQKTVYAQYIKDHPRGRGGQGGGQGGGGTPPPPQK